MNILQRILFSGILGITALSTAGCSSEPAKEGTPTSSASASVSPVPTAQVSPPSSTAKPPAAEYDFTTWDDKKVFAFLKEVQDYTKPLLSQTYATKEEIITRYQTYFSPALSKTIVDSTYFKTDAGWKTPEGDGGYMFILPSNVPTEDGNKVAIEYSKSAIRVKATYEIGLYSLIQYTIQYDQKPVITEWTMQ